MTRPTRAVLLVLAALPALGLVLAALAPTGLWPMPLFRHWAPHLAVAVLPLWCWKGRRPWPGAAIAVLTLAALWPWLLAVYAPRSPQPAAAGSATAQVANLYYGSKVHDRALAAISGDLVALVETVAGDRDRLRRDPRWPFQRWVEPRHYGGLALLSRWPMRSHEESYGGAPLISAQVETPWGSVRVLAVHTWSPVSPGAMGRNQMQFRELLGAAEGSAGPLLMMGDLNASPAEPGLLRLRDAGLLPAAGGKPATWPSWFGPCGITIDHVLARGLAIGDARAVDLAGSDHRSLVVRLGPLP